MKFAGKLRTSRLIVRTKRTDKLSALARANQKWRAYTNRALEITQVEAISQGSLPGLFPQHNSDRWYSVL